jgi:hypothetical protein
VRRNDEVEAQRRRWTFYEAIKHDDLSKNHPNDGFGLLGTPISGQESFYEIIRVEKTKSPTTILRIIFKKFIEIFSPL